MTYKKQVTHSEEWWENEKPAHVIRCTAHYKTGDRCRREAIAGGNVCKQHGGLIPAVQQKAAARIGMSLDDAVKRLRAMLDDDSVENREKIKILHDLLDRGGLGAVSKVAVGIGQIDPVERLFQDILSTPGMLAEPRTEVQQIEAKPTYDDGDSSPLLRTVVQGEVVEEPRKLTGNDYAKAYEDYWTPGAKRDEHTVYAGETGKTPPRIAESMTRQLRKAGLW
jgi:hypothetical protein